MEAVVKWALIALGIIMAFFIGMVFGSLFSITHDASYKDMVVDTCLYSNKLTDIINKQSMSLNYYTKANFTNLGKLNCTLLENPKDL